MFSHVMIGSDDVRKSKLFYDSILGVMGYEPGAMDEKGRCFYLTPKGIFAITPPIDGKPATHANGGTIGFAAKDPTQVDSWHAAGLASGGVSCEDAPGLRETGLGTLYLAYLRDPAGNKVAALHSMG